MNTVTEKQLETINALKLERSPDRSALFFIDQLRKDWNDGDATELQAEQLIAKMVLLPLRRRARFVPAGVYMTATGLVRVYYGQHSGRTLAKRICWGGERIWFQYMGLATKHVPADARRLTAEEVGETALLMNSTVCLVCGRRLDDPESVQRGIGPVCFQNYGSL